MDFPVRDAARDANRDANRDADPDRNAGHITNNPTKANLPEKWQQHPYQYKKEKLVAHLF